jgi:hypothetical protein
LIERAGGGDAHARVAAVAFPISVARVAEAASRCCTIAGLRCLLGAPLTPEQARDDRARPTRARVGFECSTL